MSFFSQILLSKCQQLDNKKNEEKKQKLYKCEKLNRSKNEEKRLKVYKC